MKNLKKISIDQFELKGKKMLISADKAKNIAGGLVLGTEDVCL